MEELSKKDKIAEYIKCLKDPVYFINNYAFIFNINTQGISKIDCFEYQEEYVRNLHNNRNNIVLKSRQCLPENTFVDTPNGQVKIQDFKRGEEVCSYNFYENKIEKDIINDAWKSGTKECIRMYLDDGGFIDSGEDHPFYIISKSDWVKTKDIKIDYKILNSKNKKGFSKVINKKRIGKRKCYDISVVKNENFLLNGLVTHNTGLSVITACYLAWRLIFRVDERILVVADNGAGAVRFLEHIRNVLNNLPSFLLPNGRPTDNTKQIIFSNGSWVKAVASSKQAGRGETLTMLVLDEAAFIEHAEDIWAGAGVALSASKGKCVMISTPYGAKGLYHKTWVAAEKGEVIGTGTTEEKFYTTKVHWSNHPMFSKGMETRYDENGKKFLWSQWYEEQCDKLHNDRTKIAQELDLSFESSGAIVIDPDVLETYEKELIDKKIECYYNYKLDNIESRFTMGPSKFRVWEKPIQGANYIVSSDIARGDGSDYSTIQVINADTLVQAAEYQDRLPPDEFAKVIYNVGKDYGNAYLAIECNSFGLATTLTLKNQLGYKANRMYHSKSVVQMFDRYTPYKYDVDKGADIPGFQTTTLTRPLIINALIKYMNAKQVKINSPRLIEEFKTFIYKNGKAEHASGYNDDLIFAFGIGLLIRDTEIEGVFWSKNMTKALLNNISMSSRSFQQSDITGTNKKPFEDDDDINNTAWLYGPTKG